jgi:nucleotide-binding universal stress UspA family protein
VDANDLVLGREYEKLIDRSYADLRMFEELRIRASSIVDLKENLRETINSVAKLSQALGRDPETADKKSLTELHEGIREIEDIIERYEKDNERKLVAFSKKIDALKNR